MSTNGHPMLVERVSKSRPAYYCEVNHRTKKLIVFPTLPGLPSFGVQGDGVLERGRSEWLDAFSHAGRFGATRGALVA
jgi:hypothetical protein